MVISNLKGGLGNYLFQLAVGYSLSIDNNTNFIIDENRIKQVHSNFKIYTNNIFRNINIGKNISYSKYYKYESLTYKPIPYSQNILIDGYFQSEKYWLGNEEEIRKIFSIDKKTLEQLTLKYPEIVNNENTCSIHVRRGDYLKVKFFNELNMGYYNKAIDEIGRDKKFIIFSDDINWCKKNFKDIDCTFIQGQEDYMDLYLMSLCNDNITANSTFSWWGSYLNTNINKKIITPKIWYLRYHSNEDVPPSSWIKI